MFRRLTAPLKNAMGKRRFPIVKHDDNLGAPQRRQSGFFLRKIEPCRKTIVVLSTGFTYNEINKITLTEG